MRVVQVVIKVFALCLAGCIIIGIFSGIVGLVALTGLMSGGDFSGGTTSTIWQEEQVQSKITKLEIEVGATNFSLRQDDNASEVRVETNNEHIESWSEGGTLKVAEKSHAFWEFQGNRELVVYIPKNYTFDEVMIDAGAGMVEIEYLLTKRLKMDLGAGKARISQVEATEYAEVEGGAGLIELKNGKMRNLDLEIGAGKAEITAEILGNSKISSGVGKLELNLVKTAGDYQLTIDKGIGSVTVDGTSQSDNSTYGQGSNLIRLDTGIGSVEVRMVN